MKSIWEQSTEMQKANRKLLSGVHHTQVAVVGGGMAGILTAYLLKEAGFQVTILEADKVGSGQTRGTTAKITAQHGMIYSHLEKYFGRHGAMLYGTANQAAIEEYARIIKKEEIDCEFRRCPAYLYALEGEGVKARLERLHHEVELTQALGIPSDFTTETELPFAVAGAEVFHNQAQFHPLKFLEYLSKGLEIYEDSLVLEAKDNCLFTEKGILEAEHIIFTNHFPWMVTPGYYFMRMHQERSYVLALQMEKQLQGMYRDMEPTGFSFRSYGEYLLLGGCGHRTGENKSGGNYDKLREQAGKWYPDAKEVMHWSAQDCVTLDHIPYIGYFSHTIPNWYIATGFGKWGMTGSMVSAIILRDMILGGENKWEEIYSPQRKKWNAAMGQLVENMSSAAVNLSKGVFTFSKKAKQEKKICRHMGCKLSWNPEEESWDCPCHGSRYSKDGEVMCGPTQKPLEKR